MKNAIYNVLLLSIFFIISAFFSPNRTLFGRPIWPSPKKIIDFQLDGDSQQIFDIFSFSHITHGVIFYYILKYLKFSNDFIVYIATFAEILWEWFENTPFIINKYRKKFKNYRGDSIVNIIGDVIFTIFGVYLTYLSPKHALIFVSLLEIILYPFKANFLYLSIGSLVP